VLFIFILYCIVLPTKQPKAITNFMDNNTSS
jgi:hypothetical protein